MRIIGAADEFWRVRLSRVDESESPDFEWRDDILYREPPASSLAETEGWRLEAVRLEDYEAVVSIAAFDSRDDAERALEQAREDLAEMTKSQFEEAYLTPASAPPASGDSDDDAVAF